MGLEIVNLFIINCNFFQLITFNCVNTSMTFEIKPQKRFGFLSRLKVKLKKFIKGFDIQKVHFDSLHPTEQKAINICKLCIENPKSKLYAHPKTGFAQIELPELFITIVQSHGFYEVDLVYIAQTVPTCDKVIFDSSGIHHIYSIFDKEVDKRMKNNILRKDTVVSDHLDTLLVATEKLTNNL